MSTTNPPQPRHPGEHLKELLAERGLLQSDLAFILGQPLKGLNLIISGKRGISPDMSKALGLALNLRHEYFANLQTAYDLACAKKPDPAVTIRANMLNMYPIREMIRRGWLKGTDADDLQMQLARFLGLSRPDEIPYLTHAAKKSTYEARDISPAQLAWLFRVRQLARTMVSPKYSQQALTTSTSHLREMTVAPEEARHVPRLLATCGVRFVIVETLPQAKIDGVCLWLDRNSPVIGMSMRYDRIDNFWFVVRHEIEHVLRRHGTTTEMVDAELEGQRAGTGDSIPEEERVANEAAAAFCVPTAKLESFLTRKYPFYYEKDVLAFAQLNGIHPGLVVGQMQHKLQRYDYLKKYQVRIRHWVLPGAIADGWKQSILTSGEMT